MTQNRSNVESFGTGLFVDSAGPMEGPSRALPRDVARIRDLVWAESEAEGGSLTGGVIYSPMIEVETQGTMEILCAHSPVYFKGRPRCAFVFHGGDRQTQEVCASRLVAGMLLIPRVANYAQTLYLHRPKGTVTVITSDWTHRHVISRIIAQYLTKLMESDPSFKRIVLRGSMGRFRTDYDSTVLSRFIGNSGDPWSHCKWSHSLSHRFSDFKCLTNISFGYGVVYELTFDEPDTQHIAADWVTRIIAAISLRHGAKRGSRFPLRHQDGQMSDFKDTKEMWDTPRVTLSARLNSVAAARAVALILACICGIQARHVLMNDFGLTERDLDEC